MKNMKINSMKNNKMVLSIVAPCVSVLLLIGFLVFNTINFSSSVFADDGYILTTVAEGTPDDSVNVQHYFNKGEKYTEKYPGKIVFSDINGEKVSADQKNFIHYQNGNMSALSKSVLLDADQLNTDQISYYSLSDESVIEKNGNKYQVINAGEPVNFSNFIWKISDTQYMFVSEQITLTVTEETQQTFNGYVEILYPEEGVAYLINQEGTYSTVSSDAYITLQNGIRVYFGSKNISDGKTVLLNMTQMVIESDDNIEIIPDEEYKNESEEQPTVNVETTDGEDGEDGTEGEAGLPGEAGEPGDQGEPGEPGNSGTNGENGTNGRSGGGGGGGAAGASGNPGVDGVGSGGENVSFNPEKMPIFNADIDPSPYGFTANVRYDDNGCTVTGATASIIDKMTGAEIYRSNIWGELASNFVLSNDTLKQDTEYILSISATYSSGTEVTQEVFKKLFKTESMGVIIERKYASEDALVVNLVKEHNSVVSEVQLTCYDENLDQVCVGNTLVLDVDDQNYDTENISVEAMNEGDKIPIQFASLERNSVYYIQIKVTLVTDGIDINIIPTNSFPLERYMTLKKAPELGEPEFDISEITNSIVITPRDISDIDNGILYFRYELYKATDIVASSGRSTTVHLTEYGAGAIEGDNPDSDSIIEYAEHVEVTEDDMGNTVVTPINSSEEGSEGNTPADSTSEDSSSNDADNASEGNTTTPAENASQAENNDSNTETPIQSGGVNLEDTKEEEEGEEEEFEEELAPSGTWLSTLSEAEQLQLMNQLTLAQESDINTLMALAPLARGAVATGYDINGAPVFTAEKEGKGAVNIPIDGTNVTREDEYKIRIVAVFYDNEGIVEYSSPFSKTITIGESIWPSVDIVIEQDRITASTVEGKLIVVDENHVINNARGITLMYVSNIEIDGSIRQGFVTVDASVYEAAEANGGRYEMPFAIQGLKCNTPYTFSIIAGEAVINGETHPDQLIGNKTFTTKTSYSPLLLDSLDTGNRSTAFSVNVLFRPSDETEEQRLEAVTTTAITGLNNMGHMSGKSLTYVEFELYGPNDTRTGPADTPLQRYMVTGKAITYVDDFSNAANYHFDSKYYTDAYLRSSAITPTAPYAITLTEGAFGFTAENLAEFQQQKLYIKVSEAYDYTYGTGHDILYQNNNKIAVGTSTAYGGPDNEKDAYIEITVSPVVPKFPTAEYYNVIELTKYKAQKNLHNQDDYYSSSNSNYTSDLTTSWSALDDNTDVGLSVRGPASLFEYAKKVKYTVMTTGPGVTPVEVASSGWMGYLPNDENKRQLPMWTFFLDAPSGSISRGQMFTVVTEVEMRYINNDAGNPKIYPNEFAQFDGKRIEKDFMLAKETPQFWVIPWSGTKGSGGEDVFYMDYTDPDQTLTTEGTATASSILFYNNDNEITDRLTPVNTTNEPGIPQTYYKLTSSAITGQLSVKYSDGNVTDKPLKLFNEALVKPALPINITDVGLQSVSNDNTTIVMKFAYTNLLNEINALGRLDAVFTNGETTVRINNIEQNKETTITETQVVGGESSQYQYDTQFVVNAGDLVELAGASKVTCTVYAYYDGGGYGLLHACSNGAIGCYALQNGINASYSASLAECIYPMGSVNVDGLERVVKLENYGNISFYAYGLEYLPKQMLYAATSTEIPLQYVLPSAAVDITPGFNTARASIDINSKHTLVKPSGKAGNIELRYWIQGEEHTTTKSEWVNATASDVSFTRMLTGLTPDKTYEYTLIGYTGTSLSFEEKELCRGTPFKTLKEIKLTTAGGVTFTADWKDRTKKSMIVPYKLENIFKDDLNSVSKVTLEVASGGIEVGKAEKTKDELKAIVDAWHDDNTGDLSDEMSIDWKPSESHKMDGNTQYTLRFTVEYIGGLGTSIEEYEIQPQNTLDMWGISTDTLFVSRGTTGVSGAAAYVSYTINGVDTKRLIAGAGETDVTYYAQLGWIDRANSDTFMPIDAPTRYNVSVDNDGNLSPQTIRFDNLAFGKTYQLVIFASVDVDNVGIAQATGGSESQYTHKFFGNEITTATSNKPEVSSAIFDVPSKNVLITGFNLERVKSIKYTLVDNTARTTTNVKLTGSDLGTNFSLAPAATGNLYTLKIQNTLSETNSYSITIQFFVDEAEDAQPATTTSLNYTPNDGSVGQRFISRLLTALLG